MSPRVPYDSKSGPEGKTGATAARPALPIARPLEQAVFSLINVLARLAADLPDLRVGFEQEVKEGQGAEHDDDPVGDGPDGAQELDELPPVKGVAPGEPQTAVIAGEGLGHTDRQKGREEHQEEPA